MKLVITPDTSIDSVVENTYPIRPSMLKYKSTHMFIASNKWDEIEITLDPKIDSEDLRYFYKVTDRIKVNLTGDPLNTSDHDTRCLCALYPDLSGYIRQAHLYKLPLDEVNANVKLHYL